MDGQCGDGDFTFPRQSSNGQGRGARQKENTEMKRQVGVTEPQAYRDFASTSSPEYFDAEEDFPDSELGAVGRRGEDRARMGDGRGSTQHSQSTSHQFTDNVNNQSLPPDRLIAGMLGQMLDGLNTIIANNVQQPSSQGFSQTPIQVVPNISDAIDIFSGTTKQGEASVKEWLATIDQLGIVMGWESRVRMAVAVSRLKGTAKEWHVGQGNVITNWLEWKTRLGRAFPDKKNKLIRLEEMRGRIQKPGEQLETYFHSKIKAR